MDDEAPDRLVPGSEVFHDITLVLSLDGVSRDKRPKRQRHFGEGGTGLSKTYKPSKRRHLCRTVEKPTHLKERVRTGESRKAETHGRSRSKF